MPIVDVNSTSESDNTIVEIADGQQSGNKAEVTAQKELKVLGTVSLGDGGIPYLLPNKIHWEDKALVPRNTSFTSSLTFTSVYNYAGNGFFYGFLINLEDANNDWYIRLNIDGYYPLFGSVGLLTSDMQAQNIYNLTDIGMSSPLSIGRHENAIRLDLRYPIKYSNNVTLGIRRSGTTKRFFAGYAMIHKN